MQKGRKTVQDNTHATQDKEAIAPGEAEATGQTEFLEIRLLDKIETIQNKSIVR
ncbi:hypothetical protein [Streptomyces sp. IBSBF 2390]|uniref:hypothetical protein n=1 Tax=Streptomyces sp. IBSBF 2390 TaxID=2903533 RepID=UPI002FDBFF3D